MKTYRVNLIKSYVVTINAKTKNQAKRVAEFYTGNIKNISTVKDRKKFNFSIKKIDCVTNESFEAEKVESNLI
jgi:hypothetical protein